MQLRGKIGILLTAAVVVAGLVWGFLPRALPVDVAEVKRAPLEVTVEEEGKTRVAERYVVSAPVAGYARRIDLDAGDAVQAGQVLAVIEPARAVALDPRTRAQAQAQVSAARAALAAAQENARAAGAAAQLAQQERTRTESLRQSNFVSAQALDNARTAETRARAAQLAAQHAVRVADFELEMARAAVASTDRLQGGADQVQVRAPVAARVLKLLHENEGAVAAGQPLLELGNPDTLEVEVEVLSTQAVQIAPGSKVILDRWGGEGVLQGTVRVVEPSGYTKISALGVEEQRVRVIVDFSSPREAWARLGDGYRVEARFVLWAGKDVLQLPTSALFRHNEGWAVFALQGGRARLTPVKTGQRAGLATQVLSGLSAGEKVITHPDDRLKDGVRVKPR